MNIEHVSFEKRFKMMQVICNNVYIDLKVTLSLRKSLRLLLQRMSE